MRTITTLSIMLCAAAACGDLRSDDPSLALLAGPLARGEGWRLTSSTLQRLGDDHAWRDDATFEGRVLAVAADERGAQIISALADAAGSVAIRSTGADGAADVEVVDPHPYLGPTGASIAALDGHAAFVAVALESGAAFSHGVLLAAHPGGRWELRGGLPVAGDIAFADADRGWLAGGVEHGALFETADGGATWKSVELPGVVGAQLGAPVIVDGEPVLTATRVVGKAAEWTVLRHRAGVWTTQASARVDLGYESSGLRLPTAIAGEWIVAIVPPTGDVIAAHGARVSVEPAALPSGGSSVAIDADGRAWAVTADGVFEAGEDRSRWTPLGR